MQLYNLQRCPIHRLKALDAGMSAGGQLAPGWGTEFHTLVLACFPVCPPVNSHTFGCLCRAMGSWGVGLVWDCSHTLHTPMPLGACVAVGQSCQKCGKCVSGVGWLTLHVIVGLYTPALGAGTSEHKCLRKILKVAGIIVTTCQVGTTTHL